ncbi:MAG: STAS domain-containing protein [Solirubrobacteraceae bacterium]
MAELDAARNAELAIDTHVDSTGAHVVNVSGELDISTAPGLEASVARITAELPERLIFDLSELRFMDSAGIAVLIAAAAKADTVRLRNPSPIIRRVVGISGLSDVLPIES